ncbi:MAG: acyl-CoA thioesterase [Dehalococcoidia bacterium]|nr:acyl-CoA thioesterase [Dehalococcoidia bacterium]
MTDAASPAPAFVHSLRVRYGECDMQGVVFNANYLAYVDDAIDHWFHAVFGDNYVESFDFMVKKMTLEWSSPARPGETVAIAMRVSRWGNTSFDIVTDLSVDGRDVMTATIVYVSVTPHTTTPAPVPERVREGLGRELAIV